MPTIVVTEIAEPAATTIHRVVEVCVATSPWWGTMSVNLGVDESGTGPTAYASADNGLLETDSEHFFAAPTDCVQTGLVAAFKGAPLLAWVTEQRTATAEVSIARDPADAAKIHLQGAPPEITRRLLDRAERCGAANLNLDTWLDVEVIVGRNGFETPTGVIDLPGDSEFVKCFGMNYLMDLKSEAGPAQYTLTLSSGTPPARPAPSFGSVLAWTSGGRAVHVAFDPDPTTCADIGLVHLPSKGAVVEIAPALRRDGTESWRVVHWWFANTSNNGDEGPVSITGDATSSLAIAFPPGFTLTSDGVNLALPGTVTATGCGQIPALPAAPEVAGASLVVAGQPVPVRGAILLERFGDALLVVGDAPIACSTYAFDSDLHYEIALPKGGQGFAALSGWRAPSTPTTTYQKVDGVALKVGKTTNGSAPVVVASNLDLVGYTVALAGSFPALDCRK